MKHSIWIKLMLSILSLSMILSLVACTPSGGAETEGSSETESSETESVNDPTDSDIKEPSGSSETKPETVEATETSENTEESETKEPAHEDTSEPKTDNVFELVDFTVSVPADREPVILQITDTQIIDASQNDRLGAGALNFWGPEHRGVECFDYISEIVENTKPDLILLTGDLIYGEFDNNGSSFAALVEFMESLGVPWAPIFGNHEGESTMGINWQCEQLEAAENCLFLQRDITGNGNYTVGIEQGGELTRVFFMLDSNGCSGASKETLINNTHFKTSSGFGNDQIKWYTKLINEIKELSPDTKLSFAFHIQLKAIVDALATYAEAGDTAFIDRLESKNEGDFGYIGKSRAEGWDKDYTVWNGLKALGVDSIFVGHVHVHSASIVYQGVRVQFGMKTSTYDQINYINNDGTIEEGYHLGGRTPWVGGSVMKLASDGSISDAYIYYCENAGGNIDWDSFDTCDHSESTSEWVINANDPLYESTVCSICGESANRARISTDEGLLFFSHEFINSKAGSSANAQIFNDGPGGMSYVRLTPVVETGNKNILLHANNSLPYTNLGGYIAILYRTSVEQKLKLAFDSTHNYIPHNDSIQTLNTSKSADRWQFTVYQPKLNDYYDGQNLSTFALFPFTVDRTMADHTDIAFIAFFSSAEEAWEFFGSLGEAYNFKSSENVAPQYYVHLNGGDTKIDDNKVITGANASVNKPHVFDCSSFPITSVADSLKLYGWCATPSGVKEYGYYVIDGADKSEYKFITVGKDSANTGILSQFAAYNYPSSSGLGLLMGETNPIKIDLAGYEGKTVTVVYVAKTNWGAEIELVHFTGLKVSCDHTGSSAEWSVDASDPQYESTTCSSCGAAVTRLVSTTQEDLLLFNHQLIKDKAGDRGELKTENGMSFVRFTPKNTTGTENVLLHVDKVNPYTNLGGYIAILYRTSLNQKLIAGCVTGQNVQTAASLQTLATNNCVDQWNLVVHQYTLHEDYDGESLATFALYPFTVDRTAEDYTDIAFVAFFSSAEEAWEFYSLYISAYGMPSKYYFNLNGNTNVDGTNISGGVYGTNAPVTVDCAGKTLNTATSLHFGGWFTTPGGIKEYGYYVVDGTDKSEYSYLYTGTNLPASFSSNIPAHFNFPSSFVSGANVAPSNSATGEKGAAIDLSKYAGKTVTVIVVANTNYGDEIELVRFTGVTVPNP